MHILVACEFSGVVRRAFRERGHDAYSCDFLEAEDSQEFHYRGDVRMYLQWEWDMLIAFPPCNHLAASGAQYWPAKRADGRQQTAINLVTELASQPIAKIAIENPVGVLSSAWRKPDQIIQPWMFGDPFNKKTCLWLKGLPLLHPSNVVTPTHNWGTNSWRSGSRKLSKLPSMKWDGHSRSRSFQGIANAMADQWGKQ